MSNKRLEVNIGGSWQHHGTNDLAEALRPVLAQHVPEGTRLEAVIARDIKHAGLHRVGKHAFARGVEVLRQRQPDV